MVMKPSGWMLFGALFSTLFLLSACGGQKDGMATVTLVTGLEHHLNPNLMDSLVTVPAKVNGVTSCVQNQLYSGWGYSARSSNNNLNTFPVGLQTPILSAGQTLASAYGDVFGWLNASNFGTISIPAPIGIPVDFGIIGSIFTSSGVDARGNCVPTANSETYSIIGHSTATISGNTSLPIRVWTLNATTPPGYTATLEKQDCSQTNDNDVQAQSCPNLNYNMVTIAAGTIQGYVPGNFVQFEYFQDQTDPGKHVTQILPITASGFSQFNSFLPDLDPLVITILDINRTPVERATWRSDENGLGKNTSSSTAASTAATALTATPTPSFTYIANKTFSQDTLQVTHGGGVTPPGKFQIVQMRLVPGGFSMAWNNSSDATSYVVGWSPVPLSDASFTPQFAATSGNSFSTTLTTQPSGAVYLRAQAQQTGANGLMKQLSSNDFLFYAFTTTPSTSPSIGGATVSWSTGPVGIVPDKYLLRFGLFSNMSGPYPTGYSNGIPVTPGTGGSGFATITGLTAGTIYGLVVEAYSNGQLVAISPETAFTTTLL